ncbi:MAG: transcriptional regulator GlxA family with amidase domain [Planctomycetota bacterium]|jgi:transcriptional regulator GlxA family with amidase domain
MPIALLLLALLLGSCGATGSGSASLPASLPASRADTQRQLVAGFVMVEGVYNTELTAPWDLLQHTQSHAPFGVRVILVAETRAPVRSYEGLRLLPDATFADCPPLDILVVPSAAHSMDTDLENQALIQFVAERGAQAAYVLSLCDGAFVVAESGLLDGRQATTYPDDLEPFARRYGERVEVIQGVSFVHDGPMISSVGGAPSFDAALYLCEVLYGRSVAQRLAHGLVIDWDRGQLQHRIVPELGQGAQGE